MAGEGVEGLVKGPWVNFTLAKVVRESSLAWTLQYLGGPKCLHASLAA